MIFDIAVEHNHVIKPMTCRLISGTEPGGIHSRGMTFIVTVLNCSRKHGLRESGNIIWAKSNLRTHLFSCDFSSTVEDMAPRKKLFKRLNLNIQINLGHFFDVICRFGVEETDRLTCPKRDVELLLLLSRTIKTY